MKFILILFLEKPVYRLSTVFLYNHHKWIFSKCALVQVCVPNIEQLLDGWSTAVAHQRKQLAFHLLVLGQLANHSGTCKSLP